MSLPLFCLLAWPAAAQPPRPPQAETGAIVDMLYELRFDSATAAAARLSGAIPGHPAGSFYQGLAVFSRLMIEDAPPAAELKAFDAKIREAEDLAKTWVSTDPVQGYYYLGAAQCLRARLFAAQDRYFKAMPEGLRGVRAIRKALALDPGLEDAYLVLGIYHYFRSRLPVLAKPFAFLLTGERGSRRLGLSELRRAADKGALSRSEALCALANIYSMEDERQWDKAEVALKELMELHPRHPLYRLRRAYVAERRGAWEEAIAFADPDGVWLSAVEPGLRGGVRAAALYRAAEAWLLRGQPEKAEPMLRELESEDLPRGLFDDWVLLRRANLYDAQGDRIEADRLYEAVRGSAARRAAREFQRLRYPAGPKTVKPLIGIETPS